MLHEKIFITVENYSVANIHHSPQDQVDSKGLSAYYAPIANLSSWTPFSPPNIRAFALTTYHSQLVLVGGWTAGKMILNTLWVSADGTNWQKSLPPMPTSRYRAAAVNTGSSGGPECLVVVGGKRVPKIDIDTVEVLMEGQWCTVHHLPEPHDFLGYFVYHNGGLYLGGGLTMFYCQLHSLLATSRGKSSSPWRTMPTPSTFDLVSFQGHLVGFDYRVHAYCPLQQSWLCVGWIDDQFRQAITGPYGQLIVLSYASGSVMKICDVTFRGKFLCYLHDTCTCCCVHHAVPPYDADNVLSEEAFCRLEIAQVPVVTSLEKVPDQLAEVIGASRELTDGYGWEDVVDLWVDGHGNWASHRPPTWRSLYEVLRELDLETLSQQIEDYLSCE